MNTRSNQEIFNYICEQFFKNGVPRCIGENGYCVYSPQNSKQIGCAVGCLIERPDAEKIDKFLAGTDTSIRDVHQEMHSMYAKYFDDEQLGFLTTMQHFHDFVLGKERYDQAIMLLNFSVDYRLNLPEYVQKVIEEYE